MCLADLLAVRWMIVLIHGLAQQLCVLKAGQLHNPKPEKSFKYKDGQKNVKAVLFMYLKAACIRLYLEWQ